MARTALQQRFSAAAWIDPTARVFGNVRVGEGASLWPYVVIRAESGHVSIGPFSNVQDHVMIHIGYAAPTAIGAYCSIAHRVVLHGCTLGDNCLVGIGATIMDGAVIGENSIVAGHAFVREGTIVPPNSIVAGHAFVREGTIVPPNSIVMGTPAKVVRETNNWVANRANAWLYHRNAQHYARGEHRAWDGPEYEAAKAAELARLEAEFAKIYGSG
jgi:carbonic anhydrase/acetyltransferase-like protein (isoleucine patch superfamily)